ncbi:DUF4381 domain-containing protein [Shewanella sp. 125m-7]
MTNTVNPALASMLDIQTPSEIGLWPLAFGYWIALFVILVLVTLGFIWLKQRQQIHAAKRAALSELAALNIDSEQYATDVSSLLKRAAMSYSDRSQVAQLSGNDWYQWLNAQMTTSQDELCRLLATRFQPNQLSIDDKQSLKRHAQHWLKTALPLAKATCKSAKELSPC